MRWRQCAKTGEMIPIDESAKRMGMGAAIHGDVTPFVSPVDGSIISDRRQLREHNLRNNVVNADEFTPEHYEAKAKERANFYQGKHSRGESLKRKQEIYETIIRAERKG
jgi:hypothetical protein